MVREAAIRFLGLAGFGRILSASFIRMLSRSTAPANKSKVGSVAGGLAYAGSRGRGYDWAFLVTSRDWNEYKGDQPYEELIRNVNVVLDKS